MRLKGQQKRLTWHMGDRLEIQSGPSHYIGLTDLWSGTRFIMPV